MQKQSNQSAISWCIRQLPYCASFDDWRKFESLLGTSCARSYYTNL